MSQLVIGLTGGIGSGKTAASDWFAAQGITVVDADLVSRLVVEPGQPALAEIRAHFGDAVITADGRLDRGALRARVFNDPAERRWLEALLHPRIAAEILRQLQAARSPYAMLVSPLLFETGQKDFVRRTLLVDVPEDVQLSRTSVRDKVDAQQVRNIMAAQMSRTDRRARADDIVVNDGSLADLYAQLVPLHQRYLVLASEQAAGG
jgi:dephospho-CoA kinase